MTEILGLNITDVNLLLREELQNFNGYNRPFFTLNFFRAFYYISEFPRKDEKIFFLSKD